MSQAMPLSNGSPPLGYAAVRGSVQALMAQNRHAEAAGFLKGLRTQFPDDVALLDDLAGCLWRVGEAGSAVALTRSLAERLRINPVAWRKLAFMQLSLGATGHARRSFTRALKYAPDDLVALSGLHRCHPIPRGSPQARRIRAVFTRDGADPGQQARAHNLLARIEEAAERYDLAFQHFGAAKQVAEAEFESKPLEDLVDRQVSRFVPEATPDPAVEGPQPAFVVGLPRSGTTLMESILLRHPEVATVGETPALEACLISFQRSLGTTDSWAWLEHINVQQASALRQAYFSRAAMFEASENTRYFIDKTPLNLFHMGFALTIFPQAKVIFMARNPLDAGLSNLSTLFENPMPFTRDLPSLARMIRLVRRSASDYRQKLGPVFRWQTYETLVSKPEQQVREVLEHLGLPWDGRCLEPDKRDGISHSASFLQVKQRINTQGVGKWRRYETQLAPLAEALGGWDAVERWCSPTETSATP